MHWFITGFISLSPAWSWFYTKGRGSCAGAETQGIKSRNNVWWELPPCFLELKMSYPVTLSNTTRLISMPRSKNNTIPARSVTKVRWKVSSDELSGAAFSDTATRRISSWLKSKKIASDFVAMSKSRLFSAVSGTQCACDRISNAVINQWLQIPFILFLHSCIPSRLLFQEFPQPVSVWEWPVKYCCHFSEKREK